MRIVAVNRQFFVDMIQPNRLCRLCLLHFLLFSIIARIRDVKEKVRVAAVQALHQNVDPRWMNEIHFCDVIQHGLTER
jgi:hypothetical protein